MRRGSSVVGSQPSASSLPRALTACLQPICAASPEMQTIRPLRSHSLRMMPVTPPTNSVASSHPREICPHLNHIKKLGDVQKLCDQVVFGTRDPGAHLSPIPSLTRGKEFSNELLSAPFWRKGE